MMKTTAVPDLEIVEIDENHIKGIAFNLIFVVWKRHTLLDAFQRTIRLAHQLSAKHPTGIGVLHVIEIEATPPDAETRKAFVELFSVPTVKHLSVTHEGSGFKAAAVRAIVSAAQTLARSNGGRRSVHNDVAQAARWHVSENEALGRSDSALRLERVVQELRKKHQEQFGGKTA